MNKKVLLFGFFLMISAAFFAQREPVENLPTFDERRLHYGFYLGINQNDFKLNLRNITILPSADADITVEASLGFNVGLIADFRLHKNLSLRFEPGLMTNSKKIYFNHLSTDRERVREVGSTYLHIPLIFKFSTDRYKNIRPYLLGGVSYDHNFSSNEDGKDNLEGEFRMKTHNFMYEVGVGVDFYLYYFKFSPSIRGVFAINNEVKYDTDPNSQWTAPINFLGTRGIFLTFAFE